MEVPGVLGEGGGRDYEISEKQWWLFHRLVLWYMIYEINKIPMLNFP